MSKTIVVLGGGTGGTLIANRLRRLLGRSAVGIVVIDADNEHVYQPGLLFVPFGKAEPGSLTRPRQRQLRSGVTFRQAAVDRVDLDGNEVLLAGGARIGYDVLVIATGARLVPRRPKDSLVLAGWRRSSPSTPSTVRWRCGERWRNSTAAGWPWR
jgi:sulfide:quinone oxidoreductase